MELDPDLRLYTRLSLGRGWQLASTLALWTALATSLFILIPTVALQGSSSLFGRPFLSLALLLLVFAPSRAIARLFEHERSGLLDQMRLCARTPSEMLATCLLGSILPYALASLALLAAHVRFDGDPWFALLALLVFCAALDIALLVYGALPAELAPDPQFTTPLLLIIALITVVALQMPGWVQRRTFAEAGAAATVALVVATLPAAAWLAGRRLRRPAQRGRRAASHLMGRWSRMLPRGGPPEFIRQLRTGLRSGGTLTLLVMAPLSVFILASVPMRPAELKPIVLNVIPYFILIVGSVVLSLTVRREREAGTLDLVRLTPQRGEAVAAGWYVGMACSIWAAVALTMGALAIAAPAVVEWTWWLPAAAVVWPALSLIEGLSRRRAGVYLWLPLLMLVAAINYAIAQDRGIVFATRSQVWEDNQYLFNALQARRPGNLNLPSNRPALDAWGAAWVRLYAAVRWQELVRVSNLPGAMLRTEEPFRFRPRIIITGVKQWQPNTPVVLAAFLVFLALSFSAAAGRVRRNEGPALAGVAMVAGVFAVAVAIRAFPLVAFPRLLPGVLVVLASFAAQEQQLPSAAGRRILAATGAAFVAGTLVGHEGGINWAWSLDTGVTAGLALGVGILVHELAWRTPLLSLLVRVAILGALIPFSILGALIPFWWSPFLRGGWNLRSLLEGLHIVPLVPPAPQLIELLALATIFAIAAVLHARRRSVAPSIATTRTLNRRA